MTADTVDPVVPDVASRPSMTRFGVRRLAVVPVLALLTLVFTAPPAFAHAGLVSASPGAGTGLPQAPGAVVLKFTEPLNHALSSIAVLDRSGHDVGQGPTLPVAGDRTAMRRKLGLLTQGVYVVHWTTVSTQDGHTLKGSYAFGIGAAALPGEQVESNPVSSQGWAGLVGGFVTFAGLSLWVGWALLAPIARRAGVTAHRCVVLAWAGPALTLVGTATSVASSAIVATGSLSSMGSVLSSSSSGHWRAVVLAAAAMGLVIIGFGHSARWRYAGLGLAIAAIVGVAASGHAASTNHPRIATGILVVHLIAVGVWIFAILASLLSRQVLAALGAFSPYAIGAALLVAATGVGNAVVELTRFDDLTSTDYGRVIGFKVMALAVMAVVGIGHYIRRHEPEPGVQPLRALLRSEATAGVVALGLAAVLVAFPNPPRTEANESRLATPEPLADLNHQPAVSLADASGPFIVSLTVLPPQPGPVEIRVQIIGVQAGDGLRGGHVDASSADEPTSHVSLHGCGLGCFNGRGQVPTRGIWRFDTHITSNRGPITTSESIPIPAADGTSDLHTALAAMGRLQSLRVQETLSSTATSTPLVTEYQYRAPDKFAYQITGKGDRVIIGSKQYSRDTPTGAWTSEADGPDTPGFSWPGTYYRDFWSPAVAVRIIGTQVIAGTTTDIVAFYRPDITAWFRLWISPTDGLVHRMEMRAEGHLMNHDLYAYNQPVTIQPPI